MTTKYWLMKAEPDSRVVKDKDVKFSVDDFESVKTTAWEGVRNYEARNLMKEMKTGDKVLFYHSNCKTPGIAGFAEVSKEAYPDHTAWDSGHPYFDPKTKQEDPKWFMVDVTFVSRATHFVPLLLLRHIADSTSSDPPSGVEYIGQDGVKAIKGMVLVKKGRLSVQRVEEETWGIIEMMAEKGGWDEADLKKSKTKVKGKTEGAGKKTKKGKGRKKLDEDEEEEDDSQEDIVDADSEPDKPVAKKRSRGGKAIDSKDAGERMILDGGEEGTRRSKRSKKSV